VTVAVLDTGVDAAHPDLARRVLPGADVTGQAANGDVDTSPDSHGTSVAAVIAASGASGMTGLAPQAEILPVRVTDGTTVQPAALAEGVGYAATHGAKVINISMVTPLNSPEVRDAVEYAVQHDIVVVAAAGNEGQAGDPVEYPAALPGVVAVAGSTREGGVWPQGESGGYIALAAPAESIYSADDQGGYLTSAGTSYSAPYVSAAAALLRAKYPDETAGQIITRLIETASSSAHGRDDQSGYGIVDPYKALTAPVPAQKANPLAAVAGVKPTSAGGHGGASTTVITTVAAAAVVVLGGLVLAGRILWQRRRRGATVPVGKPTQKPRSPQRPAAQRQPAKSAARRPTKR
jgi:type VII secretion-associated serine protease mycosin